MASLQEVAGNKGLISDGDWILSENMSAHGTIGVIQLKHVGVGEFLNKDFNFISEETFKELGCNEVVPGDILISRMADPIGRACIVPPMPFRCVTVVDVTILRNDSDVADASYIQHLCNSQFMRQQIERATRGTTRPRITRTELESIEIPLPPLPEQHRIAALLDKADHLRRTRCYAAQLGDTFLQAVFVRMFGDPVRNPMGWDEVDLDELVTFISGKSFKFSEYVSQGVRLFQIANVSFQETNWDTLAYLPTNYLEEYPQLALNPGDLLMALNRPILGEKVKFAVLSEKDCPSILYQRVGKITVKSKKIIQPFLFGLMHTRYFYHELKKRLAGSDQPYINPTELVEMRVYVPPLALQQKFARIVQQFERLRAQQREAERQAEHLFQTLLHRAFSGEV